MQIKPLRRSPAVRRRRCGGEQNCRWHFGLRDGFAMTTAARGRPGRGLAPLKEKTVHAALTKQRIHALVGQVIDELEHRRATGKADYVKALADEVHRGGLAAWKALRELLRATLTFQTADPQSA